jgi:branched-chain amino acid transport system permease protein
MNFALDTLVQGVLLGGLYALFAAGLSLIFGVMRLVNLAHGDVIVVAAFALLALAQYLGLGLGIAMLLTLPAMFALGYGMQYLLLNRVIGKDILPPLLITFGLSIFAQNGLQELFSADSRRLSAQGLESASIALAPGLAIGLMPLATLVAAVAVIVGLSHVFYRTAMGRAFRAVSDDPVTAQLMGIDNRRLFAVAMGLAFAVSAIAALFLGIRANFDPSIGPARLIFAFEAVIIGGLGSLWGTLAGGMVLGIAQTTGSAINPEWQILAGHLAFLVILLVRPRGFFPRSTN